MPRQDSTAPRFTLRSLVDRIRSSFPEQMRLQPGEEALGGFSLSRFFPSLGDRPQQQARAPTERPGRARQMFHMRQPRAGKGQPQVGPPSPYVQVMLGSPDEPVPYTLRKDDPQLAAWEGIYEILGSGQVTADDLYGGIGVDPTNPQAFASRVQMLWKEAMAASFNDPGLAAEVFKSSLLASAFPAPEPVAPDFQNVLADLFGISSETLPEPTAEEEFDFYLDPSYFQQAWGF